MLQPFISWLEATTSETEFWSAIAGAVVGGLIAFLTQIIALRAAKKQRLEDRLHTRQALANSLLFKVVRIHSDFFNIHHHVEECFEKGQKRGDTSNPWCFFIPLANPPESISFSSDEMGMLIGLKDNNVFNATIDMDVIHNSLIAVLRVAMDLRKNLTERLKVHGVEGNQLSGNLSKDEWLSLQPLVIEVNSVIEHLRTQAKKEYESSGETLSNLAALLRDKLHLTYEIQPVRSMQQ